MLKNLLTSIAAGSLVFFLAAAHADKHREGDDPAPRDSVTDPAPVQPEAADAAETAGPGATEPTEESVSIMDQPVDFSSPENVEKTMQNVREQAGSGAHNKLKNALQYLKLYDLSLDNSEAKLYQKMNGLTPNEIIARMKR